MRRKDIELLLSIGQPGASLNYLFQFILIQRFNNDY